MDTIVLVKDRNWAGTDSHTPEIPVDRLATTALPRNAEKYRGLGRRIR